MDKEKTHPHAQIQAGGGRPAEAGRQTPSKKPRRRLLVLVVVAAVFLLVAGLSLDARLKVVTYEIASDKLTGPVRIAFVADLHSCLYGPAQSELLDALAAQKPDLVLLGGDIVDDVLPRQNAEVFLAAVSAAYPCYFVTGNHEIWSEDTAGILAMIRSYGIPILQGQSQILQVRGQTLLLGGVDDPYSTSEDGGSPGFDAQLAQAAAELSEETFSLLLTHRPELVSEYGKYGFDLVLAGHAHGGQVRIPGILNGVLSPNQGFFPRYAGGAYFFGEAGSAEAWQMIVSRGLARESTHAPRIFNRPELVIVELGAGN